MGRFCIFKLQIFAFMLQGIPSLSLTAQIATVCSRIPDMTWWHTLLHQFKTDVFYIFRSSCFWQASVIWSHSRSWCFRLYYTFGMLFSTAPPPTTAVSLRITACFPVPSSVVYLSLHSGWLATHHSICMDGEVLALLHCSSHLGGFWTFLFILCAEVPGDDASFLRPAQIYHHPW